MVMVVLKSFLWYDWRASMSMASVSRAGWNTGGGSKGLELGETLWVLWIALVLLE